MPEVTPPFNPVSLILDIVKFVLGLGGGGKVDLQPLADAINTTWNNFVVASAFLYNAIAALTNFLRKMLAIIIGGIQHIIQDILHGHLLQALRDIQALFHALQALFAPILKFINDVMAWYKKHVFPIQHAILEIISRIRVILTLFRLLGAKWATKLDADLQKIQAAVTASIVDVVKTLNTISTILGLAVDPLMILRKDFFGRTLWSSLGDLKKAVGYGSARPITATEMQREQQFKSAVYGPAPLITAGPDGSIVYDPALKTVNDSMDQQMQTLGIAH